MAEAGWRAAESDVVAIEQARHGDPFAVLGPHVVDGGTVIRAFVPHAASVDVIDDKGSSLARLERRRHDVFEGLVPGRTEAELKESRAVALG